MDPLDIHANVDIARLAVGMDVIGPAGEVIGAVKEVRARDFLLDRSLRRDLYVPFSAIREIGGRSVVLAVAAADVGSMDWDEPPLFGTSSEADSAAPPADRVVGTGDPATRGTWSASSDSFAVGALDTEVGRQALEGTDDGEPPHGSELPRTHINTLDAEPPPTTETERLRDMLG
jgi:hypothetical protein